MIENPERLKGSATLRRTVNLGNYSSMSVEGTLSFFQDEFSVLAVLDSLDAQILQWLDTRGIKNEVKAVPK